MAQSVRSTRRGAGAKKTRRAISSGQVHIFASFNNTIVTVTDTEGNTVAWGSAGSAGFKGSRKSTPFAARLAAEQAIKAAQQLGIQQEHHSHRMAENTDNRAACAPRQYASQ